VKSGIDLLVVLHNSENVLGPFLNSLHRLSVPVTVFFLDNHSADGTAETIVREIGNLPFPAYFVRSLTNNGFAGGMNLLARMGTAEFIFILNPDTELESSALQTLVKRAQTDSKIAICEARQSPREHPKWSDPVTGETTWCSGAAALIRRNAFEDIGGFDERLFFMYCEDVDLSWKLWAKGWKCVYVREAVVTHHTQDLMPGKRRTLENYFTFRNSLFLLYRFGTYKDWRVLSRFLRQRFLSSRYSVRSKFLFVIALIDHIRYIPYLLQTRDIWSGGKHPWVRFEETSLSG
jgi:GT2 family glycosyltransferase